MPNHRFALCAAAFGVALITTTARADLIVLEAMKDNTLYESATGALSNGAGNSFFAGRTASGQIRRGLLAFDIASAVPAGATITSASLTLFMSNTSAGDTNVALHSVLKDWGEGASNATGMGGGGGGAPAEAGDATWLHTFYDDMFWDTPGGDYDPVESASILVGDSINFYTWGTTGGMVNDVQSWLDAPVGNFGWMVKADESFFPSAKRFEAREQPLTDFTPKLSIEYQAVPGPAAMALFAVAGLASGRRRRDAGAA